MKYKKYLIITLLIFIILLTTFLYTKNIFYFYSTIPIIICASIIGYFQEKNKLSIKTNKILNLLKYERIFYTFAVIIPYIVSFTYKIEKVENYFTIAYITSVIFLLLYAIICFKRTLLIRGLQNLGLTRGVMSFKLMIPFFKKIDIKKIIFLLKFNS